MDDIVNSSGPVNQLESQQAYRRELERQQRYARLTQQGQATAERGVRSAAQSMQEHSEDLNAGAGGAAASHEQSQRVRVNQPAELSRLITPAVREELARLAKSGPATSRGSEGRPASPSGGAAVAARMQQADRDRFRGLREQVQPNTAARPTAVNSGPRYSKEFNEGGSAQATVPFKPIDPAAVPAGVESPQTFVNAGARASKALTPDESGGTATASPGALEAAFQQQLESDRRLDRAGMARQQWRQARQDAERATFAQPGDRTPAPPGQSPDSSQASENFSSNLARQQWRQARQDAERATFAQPGDVTPATSDQEQAYARELEQQRQAAAQRELEQMGSRKRLSDERFEQTAARGGRLAARFQAAAADANWPFYLVIALSVFNDVVDIFDLGSLLGLDQVFDSLMFLMMLSARLFVRQGSGWIASKVAAMAVEWIPLVGMLPCWTIAAVYVWRRALRLRRARQGVAVQEAAALADETDATRETEQEPAYAEAGTSGN